MATKRNTKRWEEINSQYNRCLYYSETRGLYMSVLPDNPDKDELLYVPHGYWGFNVNIISVPDSNMDIEIHSNFEFGKASYLYALIKKEGSIILNFDTSKLRIKRFNGVKLHGVLSYDWDNLFEKIISAYKISSLGEYTTSAIAYVDGIKLLIDQEDICFKENINDDKELHIKGNQKYLYVGEKISDLLCGLELSKISDTVINEHTLDLCKYYMEKAKYLFVNTDENKMKQISKILLAIHKFMCDKDKGGEYLRILLKK